MKQETQKTSAHTNTQATLFPPPRQGSEIFKNSSTSCVTDAWAAFRKADKAYEEYTQKIGSGVSHRSMFDERKADTLKRDTWVTLYEAQRQTKMLAEISKEEAEASKLSCFIADSRLTNVVVAKTFPGATDDGLRSLMMETATDDELRSSMLEIDSTRSVDAVGT